MDFAIGVSVFKVKRKSSICREKWICFPDYLREWWKHRAEHGDKYRELITFSLYN